MSLWLLKIYSDYKNFHPHYLKEHDNAVNIKLHFTGATAFFFFTILSFVYLNFWLLLLAIFAGYFFPHIGHKYFQKNDSMRISSPIFCIVGAFLNYINTWRLIFRKLF